MPTHDDLGVNDDKVVLPSRPESGERYPERTIERGNPRPRPILGIDRELLPQRQMDGRLLSVISKEGEDGVKGERCETNQGAQREGILRDFAPGNESESRYRSGVSSEDGERGSGGKAQ